MYALFLDTTQSFCNIAVIKDDYRIINKVSIKTNNNLTDLVVEHINTLLSKSKINSNDIQKMYVVNGPGSFTGTKVVTTIAKTWYSVHKIPIYTTNSLLIQTINGTGLSFIDAKSNKTYVACYDNFKEILKPQIVDNNKIQQIKKKLFKYKIISAYPTSPSCYFDNLINHLPHFVKVTNVVSFVPLYLKSPV